MAAQGNQIDRSTLKVLMLTNLPMALRDRNSILEVLSKYGDIQRVTFRDADKAIVAFKNHKDAAHAKVSLKKESLTYKQISIQWCSLQRTPSENSPALTKDKSNPFDVRSNLFKVPPSEINKHLSQDDFPPLSSSTATPRPVKQASAISMPASSTVSQTKPLFGKRSFEATGASGNLFSRAIQESTSSVAGVGKPGSSGNTGAGLFRQDKEPAFAARSFTSRSDRFPSPTAFGQQRFEEGGLRGENAPSEPTKNPFASAAGAGSTLFGKPVPPTTTKAFSKENLSQAFGGFKAPAESASRESPINFFTNAGAPNAPLTKSPATLFGKPVLSATTDPVAEPDALKAFSLQNKPKFSFSRSSASDSSPKRNQNPALPPTKWVASAPTTKEQPVVRPSLGAKADSGSAFGNRVWVKNTGPSVSASPPKPFDARNQQGARSSLQSNVLPETSLAPVVQPANQKPMMMQTRSQTNPGLARFSDLFSHSANSLSERHKVLEMKDKILRELLSGRTQEGHVKGTCLDMCPEKERYQRGDRNQVDKFEMVPGADGVMDPSRMVKEYQRSAADQELPLPHELRTPAGMNLTMNYLIRYIISAQPSSNCGEWFTFVWNRTRAIRKDIAQQKIEADPICAQILERCSRFHIHCAHALCEEDPHSFDPKLNNENLTKCLKSLKYSYQDLKLEGVRCANEAEFVAYEILINLNDAGVAKTITDLEPDIRRHPCVKFAVSAMYALHAGNHVRFFHLVQSAPYLIACILHRFFTEVRVRAVSVLSKSLNKNEGIQMSTLTADLYFNNENECASFIANFGIEVDEHGLAIIKSFQPAESRLEDTLSRRISEKMGPSLAQVVYGPGEIPSHHYEPQDSFTADGTLKRSALDLPEDGGSAETFSLSSPSFDVRPFQPSVPVSPLQIAAQPAFKPRVFTDRELLPTVDALVDAVINEQMAMLLRDIVNRQALSLQVFGYITEGVASEEVRAISKVVLEAERQADRLRREAILASVCAQVTDELLERNTRLFAREIASVCRADSVKNVCSVISASIHERLFEDVTRSMVSQIARKEHESCFDAYRVNLAKILRSTHLARRYLRNWKRWVVIQKEIRDFPAGPILSEPKQYGHIKQKSPSQIRKLQSEWDALREQTLHHELIDSQPIQIDRIFAEQLVKVAIISNKECRELEKSRRYFKTDSSVRFCADIPESLLGSNAVVVFPENDPTFVIRVQETALRIFPAPAIGVVWTDCKPEHTLRGFKEVLWTPEESPLRCAVTSVLNELVDEIPSEPRLEEASLRGFVCRGIEHCLKKICASYEHLPTTVKLMNDIVSHLAAVASSQNLLPLNSLRLEAGWNSRENLSKLYKDVSSLIVPVPDTNDRLDFLRTVESAKNITLLLTEVNVKDFRNDFTFLGHIFNQLGCLLNCAATVRYLQEDFDNYEVPEFWYARPMPETPVAELTSRGSEASEMYQEENISLEQRMSPLKSLAETKQEVQQLLQRCQRARTLRTLETLAPQKILKSPESAESLGTKSKRRKSFEVSFERNQSPLEIRTSKQMKLSMAIEDLRRTVDRLKEKRKFKNLERDSDEKEDRDIV